MDVSVNVIELYCAVEYLWREI